MDALRRLSPAFALVLSLVFVPSPVGAEAETLELAPVATQTLRDERLDEPRDPRLASVSGRRHRSSPAPNSGRVRLGTYAHSADDGRRAVGRTGNLLERFRGFVRFDLEAARRQVAAGKEVKLALLDFATGPARAVPDHVETIPNSSTGCSSLIDRISVLDVPVGSIRSGLPVEGFKGPAGAFHRLSPRRYDVTQIVRGWLHDRKDNHGIVLTRQLLPTNAKKVVGSAPKRENARRRWEMGWLRQRAFKVQDTRLSQHWEYACLHDLSDFKLTLVLADKPPRKPLALQDWKLQPVETDTIASAERNGKLAEGHVPRDGLWLNAHARVQSPPQVFNGPNANKAPKQLRVLMGTWAISQDRDQPLGRTHTTNVLNRYRGFLKFDLGPLADARAHKKLRTALLSLKIAPAHHRTLRREILPLPNSSSGCHQGAVIETISVTERRHTANTESDPQAWNGTTFETGDGFHKLSPTQYDITEIVRHWLRGVPNHGMWIGARVYPADGYTELSGGARTVGKQRRRRADVKWLRQPGYRLPDANRKTWRFSCLAELHSFELTLLFDKE